MGLGHVSELGEMLAGGVDINDEGNVITFIELAMSGVLPPDEVSEVIDGLSGPTALIGLPLWAARGDTTSIDAVVASVTPLLFMAALGGTEQSQMASFLGYAINSAAMYRALARRDTVEALDLSEELARYPCRARCYQATLMRAQLLSATGRDEEAAELLGGFLFTVPGPPILSETLWILERARVNERLGNDAVAIEAYDQVVNRWNTADDVLQPVVAEAREGLRRLVGEGA